MIQKIMKIIAIIGLLAMPSISSAWFDMANAASKTKEYVQTGTSKIMKSPIITALASGVGLTVANELKKGRDGFVGKYPITCVGLAVGATVWGSFALRLKRDAIIANKKLQAWNLIPGTGWSLFNGNYGEARDAVVGALSDDQAKDFPFVAFATPIAEKLVIHPLETVALSLSGLHKGRIIVSDTFLAKQVDNYRPGIVSKIFRLPYTTSTGKTIALRAVELGKDAIVKNMICNKENFTVKETNGNTTLHYALKFPDILKLLLTYNETPFKDSNHGGMSAITQTIAENNGHSQNNAVHLLSHVRYSQEQLENIIILAAESKFDVSLWFATEAIKVKIDTIDRSEFLKKLIGKNNPAIAQCIEMLKIDISRVLSLTNDIKVLVSEKKINQTTKSALLSILPSREDAKDNASLVELIDLLSPNDVTNQGKTVVKNIMATASAVVENVVVKATTLTERCKAKAQTCAVQ